MSISKLTECVFPPSTPVEAGTRELWKSVVDHMGMQLPPDYFDYSVAYGSGAMCNGFMLVFNWASPRYASYVSSELKAVRSAGSKFGRKVNVYPENPGLLPWGRDENGTSLCWLTGGNPDIWPIIVQTVEGDEYKYPTSMTSFLASVLRNEIKCPVWHEPFTPDDLTFRPTS